ncbi:MAG: BatA domain-containing protein [Rubripirellula sp.]
MSFLNVTLIFGMAAIAVPIALHLLARREPRKVIFPSVAFLTKRFQTNRSRLRVRRWWLLAMRIAALAALALALARPNIHRSMSITWMTIALLTLLGVALLVMASIALSKRQSRTTSYALGAAALAALLVALIWGGITYVTGPAVAIDNAEPVAIAIVLDNSPTSAWTTSDDNRIGRMKDLATWMVTRVPPTSRIAIVDRSAQPASFSLDVASAVSKIEQLSARELVQPIASRLDAAARLVRTSDLPNRQVLLVTDLAASTWGDNAKQAGLDSVLSEAPSVALTVLDLGSFEGVNRSLTIPDFEDTTPARGVPIALSTTLSLQAPEESGAVSVTAELELFDNDPSLPVVRNGVVTRPQPRSVGRTSAKLTPGGSSELVLTIPFLETGIHHGQVRLIGDDAMPLDDIRYFTLKVLPASRVLLVCDDPDEVRVITRAITATSGMQDEANAEFAVERVEYSHLSVVRLSDFEAVLMLDPPADVMSDEAVTEYVNAGGGVMLCLGPAAGEEAVSTTYAPEMIRRWRSPDPGTFFQVINDSSPITEAVAADTPWADFSVSQYWQVKTEPTDSVLIQYAGTSHPAVIQRLGPSRSSDGQQRESERGRVLVVTTPIPALGSRASGWNDLFGTSPWPAWILLRKSVDYVTRRGGSEAMSLVGQPQTIRITETETDDISLAPSQRIQMFSPGDSLPTALDVPENASQVTTTDIARSGTYWMRGAAPGDGFSVNTPPDAIRLQRMEPEELSLIFGPDQFRLATSREEIEFAELESSQRVSLHSPAMLFVLIAFLLEQVLGNRFYRKTAGG